MGHPVLSLPRPENISRPRLSALGIVVALVSLAVVGCSNDRRVFRSTPDLPLNYTLVDTASGQSVWSMEVPVMHKLVVDLDRADEYEIAYISGLPATEMRWYLYQFRPRKLVDEGAVDLQGMPVVQKISYRPAPELPKEYVAPGMEDVGEGLFAPGEGPAVEEAAPGLMDEAPAAEEGEASEGDESRDAESMDDEAGASESDEADEAVETQP